MIPKDPPEVVYSVVPRTIETRAGEVTTEDLVERTDHGTLDA